MTDATIIRNTLKAKRLALSAEYQQQESLKFLDTLQTFFQTILPLKRVGIYLAGKGELDLGPSIAWLWQQGYALYAPVLREDALLFCEYTPATKLSSNQFGLREPANSKAIATPDLDYVLVPLLAFDPHGHRLGMGKGYYDRSFAFRKQAKTPILLGCAYQFQEVPMIEAEPHDVMMDWVLTPTTAH